MEKRIVVLLLVVLLVGCLCVGFGFAEEEKPEEVSYADLYLRNPLAFTHEKINARQRNLMWNGGTADDGEIVIAFTSAEKKQFLEAYTWYKYRRRISFEGMDIEGMKWGEKGVLGLITKNIEGNSRTVYFDLNQLPTGVKKIGFKKNDVFNDKNIAPDKRAEAREKFLEYARESAIVYDFGNGKTVEMDEGWLSPSLKFYSLGEDGLLSEEYGFGGSQWDGKGKIILSKDKMYGGFGAEIKKTISGEEISFKQFWQAGKKNFDATPDMERRRDEGKKDMFLYQRFGKQLEEPFVLQFNKADKTAAYGAVPIDHFSLRNTVADTPEGKFYMSREKNPISFFYKIPGVDKKFFPSAETVLADFVNVEYHRQDLRDNVDVTINSNDYILYDINENAKISTLFVENSGDPTQLIEGEESRYRFIYVKNGGFELTFDKERTYYSGDISKAKVPVGFIVNTHGGVEDPETKLERPGVMQVKQFDDGYGLIFSLGDKLEDEIQVTTMTTPSWQNERLVNMNVLAAKIRGVPLERELQERGESLELVQTEGIDVAEALEGLEPADRPHAGDISGFITKASQKVIEDDFELWDFFSDELGMSVRDAAGDLQPALEQGINAYNYDESTWYDRKAKVRIMFGISGSIPTDNLAKKIEQEAKVNKNVMYVTIDVLDNPQLAKKYGFDEGASHPQTVEYVGGKRVSGSDNWHEKLDY